MVYAALDQGTRSGEERAIGRDLEGLISDMVTEEGDSHHETDDEGIEKDEEEDGRAAARLGRRVTLQEVVRRCERHLGEEGL